MMLPHSSTLKIRRKFMILFSYAAAALPPALPHLLCDNSRPETLRWLLAPTAALVTRMGSLTFLWDPSAGYVSHELRCIIAPSCSGMTFFTVSATMMIYSFFPRTFKKGSLWIPASLLLAYISTILANSLRILLAIHIPLLALRYDLMPAGLTQEAVHTMIGAGVYFPSLLLLYPTAEGLSSLLDGEYRLSQALRQRRPLYRRLLPALWYLAAVLGIPFLLRLLHSDTGNFTDYAAAVLTVCIPVLLFSGILPAMRLLLAGLRSGRFRRNFRPFSNSRDIRTAAAFSPAPLSHTPEKPALALCHTSENREKNG